jgi:hypothetical protein
MSKQLHKTNVLFLFLVLLSISAAFPSQPALAGINGQQLEIRTIRKDATGKAGYKAQYVRFTGTNTNNQTYTYEETISPAVYEKRFPNIWWKGRVLANITVYDFAARSYFRVSCFIDVPTSQISDYTVIMFGRSSCY